MGCLHSTCTYNYFRMVTRERPRLAGGHSGNHTFNWCYIENYMVGADHSDGVQGYVTGWDFTVRFNNVHCIKLINLLSFLS